MENIYRITVIKNNEDILTNEFAGPIIFSSRYPSNFSKYNTKTLSLEQYLTDIEIGSTVEDIQLYAIYLFLRDNFNEGDGLKVDIKSTTEENAFYNIFSFDNATSFEFYFSNDTAERDIIDPLYAIRIQGE